MIKKLAQLISDTKKAAVVNQLRKKGVNGINLSLFAAKHNRVLQ
jgi:hypothetical protein